MNVFTTEHKSSCDTFFLRDCKNITNSLFWLLWTSLATSIKNKRHCKLAILGTFGVLDHPHQKSYYQFVGNFRAYLHPKIQLHYSLLSYDIAKNSELIRFNLVMSGHTHTQNDSINLKKPLMFICRKKNQLHSSSFP